MVCLGNICRSPMAEAILKDLVKDRNDSGEWIIESSATARYHIGEQPDDRCLQLFSSSATEHWKYWALWKPDAAQN